MLHSDTSDFVLPYVCPLYVHYSAYVIAIEMREFQFPVYLLKVVLFECNHVQVCIYIATRCNVYSIATFSVLLEKDTKIFF